MLRRTFISALAGGVTFGKPLVARPYERRKATNKKLVVLFQRGGNDGLNSMFPVVGSEFSLYQNLRPGIHVPQSEALSIPGNSFFGLHPALSPLIPMIQNDDLCLIHAVGYPSPNRSHFESQSYYETAVPGNGLLSGWLNRFLANTTGPGLIRGISIGSNIPQSVTGIVPVPVSNNFGRLNIDVDFDLENSQEDPYRQKVRDLFNLSATPSNDSIYSTGNKIFQMVDSFSERDRTNYVPENNAVYPDTSIGDQVMHAAQMLKDDTPGPLGVEIVTINQGGYDSHANQVNQSNPTDVNSGVPRNIRRLASSMRAFYTDMGPTRMQDIIFLVVSEFGRRAYQNDSWGTDHGTGSLAMVMGGGGLNRRVVNDGSDWPGLGTLYQGHDLQWVTDFRDIYWEILTRHLGLDNATANAAIPGHVYNPLNIL